MAGASRQQRPLGWPLHPDLRWLILCYGNFNHATYDAFNSNPRSKYCNNNHHGKPDFFHKVQFDEAADGYDVISFLHETADVEIPDNTFPVKPWFREAWDKEANWIGYITMNNGDMEALRSC